MASVAPALAKFTVALVQMSMVADPRANLEKAVRRVKEAAAGGARLVCLPELFRTLYIGQREDHALFDLAEPVPGPSTETLGKLARELGVVIVASLFGRRGCITIPPRFSTPTAGSEGSTARCTSPTIRRTTRSSTSPLATWDSRRS